MNSKKVVILGGGGFIDGRLGRRLKDAGCHVRIADSKNHDFFSHDEIYQEFILADLRDPRSVELVTSERCDEVYQLAADIDGAGYIFTGLHGADVMYNSAIINLNVAKECASKNVDKVFYSSPACMHPECNQLDPTNPNYEETSTYSANPDSEYGWEKLFSERLYMAFHRNYGMNARVARFYNIFDPKGTWTGGKEKAPAAVLRKAAETGSPGELEVWGGGQQTRSFLYIDECEAVLRPMGSDFMGPVSIDSEEMVTINELAQIAIDILDKSITISNIYDTTFWGKYGFECPTGVRGHNSDNRLCHEKISWEVFQSLREGMAATYEWIREQVEASHLQPLALG